MGFNPSSIKRGPERTSRKILLYGPPKLGKSTLAGSTRNALLIPTENRVAHIDCDKTDVVTSYSEVMDIFEYLLSNKTNYKRIIIDTIDWFEPMVHEHVCSKIGVKSLTDETDKKVNFSRGLKIEAPKGWRNFFENCDIMANKGFDNIFVSHSKTIPVSPADSASYDKEVCKIHKDSIGILEEYVDIIAYYNRDFIVDSEGTGLSKKGKAKSLNTRTLHLNDSEPGFMSGNSYGLNDITVTLDQCSNIMEYLLTENNNAVIKTAVTNNKKENKKEEV